MNKTTKLAGLLLLILAAEAQAQRSIDPATGQRDQYGYAGYLSPRPGVCQTTFIPNALARATVLHEGEGDFDQAWLLNLERPFEFYGTAYTQVWVSENGYLAWGLDDGADMSPGCILPNLPANEHYTEARLMVAHQDWKFDAFSSLHASHHTTCPERSGTNGVEACTIVTWENMLPQGNWSTERASFQVVLYHQTHAIQVAFDGAGSPGVHVGLQRGLNQPSGRSLLCPTSGETSLTNGACWYDPRFRHNSIR